MRKRLGQQLIKEGEVLLLEVGLDAVVGGLLHDVDEGFGRWGLQQLLSGLEVLDLVLGGPVEVFVHVLA
jgi:hypothetical protein